MFKYTKAALKHTTDELKNIAHIFTLIMQGIYLVYLIFAFAIPKGNLYINIVMTILAVFHLVMYLVTYQKKEKSVKKTKKISKNIYKILKLTTNAVSLAMTVYSIIIVNNNVTGTSFLSLIATVFMAIGWIIQVLLLIVSAYVEKKAKFLLESLYADFEPTINAVNKAQNVIRKLKREEIVEKEEFVREKSRKLLNELVEESEEERLKQKTQKKELKKERITLLKEQAKELKRIKREQKKAKKVETENDVTAIDAPTETLLLEEVSADEIDDR